MPKCRQPTFPIPDGGVPEGFIVVGPRFWFQRLWAKYVIVPRDVIQRTSRNETFLRDATDALSSDRSVQSRLELMRASAAVVGAQEFYTIRTAQKAGCRMLRCICSPGMGHKKHMAN